MVKKNPVRFKLIAASMVFLFNPNMTIIDILPDFLGYILLVAALLPLSDLDDDIKSAYGIFKKMIFVDASKWLALFWVFSLSQHRAQEFSTSLLLVTFIYSLLEILLLVTAFKKLFGGLITLGYFNENTAILGAKSKSAKRNYTEKIRNFTIFFVAFKAVMSVLPEFAVLATHSYDDTSRFNNIYNYIYLLRALPVILVLVLGVVWLVKIIVYFARASRDAVFNESVRERYIQKVALNLGVHVKRAASLCFLALTFAAVFSVDFRSGDFNIIPDMISAACFIIGVLFIVPFFPQDSRKSIRMKLYAPLLLYLLTTGVGFFAEYAFYSEHNLYAVYRNEEAFFLFILLGAAKVVEALSFVFAVVSVSGALRELIRAHAGFLPTEGDVARQLAETQKEISRVLYFLVGAAVLAAAGDLFYIFGAADIAAAGLVNFVTTVIFIVSVLNAKSDISEGIEVRYLYD